ncbi:MAG: membrane dipeptidase, partial [Allosphingosinicella sp.]
MPDESHVAGIDGTHSASITGVDAYPVLFAELARRGWSDADLARLAGENLLRAMAAAERTAAAMKNEPPLNATIEHFEIFLVSCRVC